MTEINSQLLKAKTGDVLLGTISYMSGITFPLSCSVPALKQDPPTPEPEDKRPPAEQLEERVLKLQVEFLSKLIDNKQFEDYHKLLKEPSSKHPEHLLILQLELKAADSAPGIYLFTLT